MIAIIGGYVPDATMVMLLITKTLDNPPIPQSIEQALTPSEGQKALILEFMTLLDTVPGSLVGFMTDPLSIMDDFDICVIEDHVPGTATALAEILDAHCPGDGIESLVDLGLLLAPITGLKGQLTGIGSNVSSVLTATTSTTQGTLFARVKVIDERVETIKTGICSIVNTCAPYRDDDDRRDDDREGRDVVLDVSLSDGTEEDDITSDGSDDSTDQATIESLPLLPTDYSLNVNYPNPFNPQTEITFALPNNEHATIEVFDVTGRKIATLLSQGLSAGYHQIRWDASNMASGTYFYKLTAGAYTSTRQMTLTK